MKSFYKIIYKLIPFKKHLFLLLKTLYTPSPKLYQHLNFKSIFKVITSEKTSFKVHHYGDMIENEIFWNGIYGGFEKNSMKLWAELVINSHVIFDIGANTGIYSLLAKSLNSASTVYAFEPVDRVHLKLVRNNFVNRFDINCIKKAASNYNGKATIYDPGTDHIYSVTVNKNLDENPNSTTPVQIDAITLDSFVKNEKIENIDLVKIDVETHEVEVMMGFKENIRKFQPSILIEILNDEVAQGVMEIIEGIDYTFINIDEDKGFRIVDQLTKSDQYNFLICKKEIVQKLSNLIK